VANPSQFTPSTDELVANNRRFAAEFADRGRASAPQRHLAIVACMDSRLDVGRLLGLDPGDAHIIRNAGGVVTDDVIRSLVLSQRLLGTREVILIHHTDCGLQKVNEDDLKDQIEKECGVRPRFDFESFGDPAQSVRRSMDRLRSSPFIVHKIHIRGFVYDVDDGNLREVDAAR